MKIVIWLLVAILIIAHQDFWNWNDASLVKGFLPIGLVYHIGISICASIVWLIACTFAWPDGIDEFDDKPVSSKESSGGGA